MSKDGLNQFGIKLAYRKKTTIEVWQCSECGTVVPFADNPLVRCSNRKGGCGRLLHDEPESAKTKSRRS